VIVTATAMLKQIPTETSCSCEFVIQCVSSNFSPKVFLEFSLRKDTSNFFLGMVVKQLQLLKVSKYRFGQYAEKRNY